MMHRAILFASAASLVCMALPAAAAEADSALSKADQERVVCVPIRDEAGGLAGGEICKTGREWEVALAGPRATDVRDGGASTAAKSAYLANPYVIRLSSPSLLTNLNRK